MAVVNVIHLLPKNVIKENIIVLKTKEGNIKEIYEKMLNNFYDNLPPHIIGVTGTSGKTS